LTLHSSYYHELTHYGCDALHSWPRETVSCQVVAEKQGAKRQIARAAGSQLTNGSTCAWPWWGALHASSARRGRCCPLVAAAAVAGGGRADAGAVVVFVWGSMLVSFAVAPAVRRHVSM
jgi:hypothetical protein